jgi:hypothetical protein
MFRCTLRDLFWLTIVVALALGWRISAGNLAGQQQVTKRHAEALRMALDHAQQNHYVQLEKLADDPDPEADLLPVDWELATREIP